MIDGGLRPIFREKLRSGFHWQSIETGGTGLGIPDSNYCSGGVEGWVEYKLTDAWSVSLTPEQVGWHRKRFLSGGLTFVAVRKKHNGGPRKGVAVDELWLYEGRVVRELKEEGLRITEGLLHHSSGGPSNWDWDEVSRHLRKAHP